MNNLLIKKIFKEEAFGNPSKIIEGYKQILQGGFWFVDIPRTSSSSIRVELGKRFGEAHGKFDLIEKKHAIEPLFKNHIPAQEMSSFLSYSKWDKLFTFTVVRNPWDRTHSLFRYLQKDNRFLGWSFREYITTLEKCYKKKEKPFRHHSIRYGAYDYIVGEDGEIIVDYIARYETRDEDLLKISSRLGIEELGKLSIQKCSPKDRHYSEFYDEKTRDIIYRVYSKDIELFGYEFEKV